jgi:hypothetical protein
MLIMIPSTRTIFLLCLMPMEMSGDISFFIKTSLKYGNKTVSVLLMLTRSVYTMLSFVIPDLSFIKFCFTGNNLMIFF